MYINNKTTWLARVQGKTQMTAYTHTHTLLHHQVSSAMWQDEDDVIKQKMERCLAAHESEGRSCAWRSPLDPSCPWNNIAAEEKG